MTDCHRNDRGQGHQPGHPGQKGKGHHKGCDDTLVLILDDRDEAGDVLVEGDFREEDIPYLEIVNGDLVLAMDTPPGFNFTAIVDGQMFTFQDWSGG